MRFHLDRVRPQSALFPESRQNMVLRVFSSHSFLLAEVWYLLVPGATQERLVGTDSARIFEESSEDDNLPYVTHGWER